MDQYYSVRAGEPGLFLCLKWEHRQWCVLSRRGLTQPDGLCALISTNLTDESTLPFNTQAKQIFHPLTLCSVSTQSKQHHLVCPLRRQSLSLLY